MKDSRIAYLSEEDILDDAFEFLPSLKISNEVLVAIHSLLLSTEDFTTYRNAHKLLEPRKTETAGKILAEVCERRLAQYKTSIEEDNRLLKTDLTWRTQAAVEVRLGEKRILVGVRDAVASWGAKRASKDTAGSRSKKLKM